MLKVMAKWSPSDDDLILLRRSIGIHADPEDIEHLDPAMVAAYKETSYAKWIADHGKHGQVAVLLSPTMSRTLLIGHARCTGCYSQ